MQILATIALAGVSYGLGVIAVSNGFDATGLALGACAVVLIALLFAELVCGDED